MVRRCDVCTRVRDSSHAEDVRQLKVFVKLLNRIGWERSDELAKALCNYRAVT